MSDAEIHEPARSTPGSSRASAKSSTLENKVARNSACRTTPKTCACSRSRASRTCASAADYWQSEEDVGAARVKLGVRPVFKRIDTCAAEFASPTAYMYSTYETPFAGASRRSAPSDRKKIVILGGGPNRIGQGIEFDYCCCHACFALREAAMRRS